MKYAACNIYNIVYSFADITYCRNVVNKEGCKAHKKPHPSAVEPGEVLLVFVEEYNEWDRAVVLANLEGGQVSLKSVEYGNVFSESITNMRALTAAAAKVPMRAVQCKLAGEMPELYYTLYLYLQ